MNAPETRLLVIDDNPIDRERVRRLLGGRYALLEAGTAREGLELCEGDPPPACVLLDHQLPDGEGAALVSRFVARGCPVIMLTGQGNEAVAVEAMKQGAQDYLIKGGLQEKDLLRSVENTLERARLLQTVADTQRQLVEHVSELDRRSQALEEANARLLQREAQLRAVLEQLPAVLWTVDRELRLTSLRGHGAEGWWEEGAPLQDQLGEDALAAHHRALGGEPAQFELHREDGALFRCAVSPLRAGEGEPSGCVGVAIDVREQRALEAQLRQAQKMDAVGQLAGGVAHDFNNLLTVILGFSSMIAEELPEGSPLRQNVEEVLMAGSRAMTITRQLLTFSRRQVQSPQVLDVGERIMACSNMFQQFLSEEIEIEFRFAADGWLVRVDPGLLEQVLLNLVLNARDAMAGDGRITFQTANRRLEPEDGAAVVLPAGEYLELTVSDTGAGIPLDIQDRIFEPFFTTKGPSRGTGLGLPTCYGIIRQAGGDISFRSAPGEGTTFTIFLPRAAEPKGESAPAEGGFVMHGHGELILVVEDDAAVRKLAASALRSLGYCVLEASDGVEGEQVAGQSKARIELLLTDVVMPRMSGIALAQRLRERDPRLKVMLMTGYMPEDMEFLGGISMEVPILDKPFSIADLAQQVREVLEGW